MTIGVVQAVAFNSATPTITATGGPGHSLIAIINSNNSSGPSISGVTIGGVPMVVADGVLNSARLSWIYYLSGVASGQTALAVSGTNLNFDSSDGGVDIVEVDCPIVRDGHNHNSANSATLSTGSSGPLSVPEEIAVGGICAVGPSSPTAGWTGIGSGFGRYSAYQVLSSESALNLTATALSGSVWAAAISTFRRGSLGNSAGAFMGLLV